MNVLVACERSGIIRDAFLAIGHTTWSCDLANTTTPGPHFIADAIKVAYSPEYQWDLMIAHPPCTHLAISGSRYFADKQDGRQQDAIAFFMALVNAPIPHICVENPISIMSTTYRPPDQIIQPYEFGHPEAKATCLWLKNLPALEPTKILPLPACGYWNNQTPSGQNKLPPSPHRATIRSTTYTGIAAAMATQWGTRPLHVQLTLF